jgi:hypothetical protein
VPSVSRTFSLPRRGRQVIEADLNCSELRRPACAWARVARCPDGNARSGSPKLFIPNRNVLARSQGRRSLLVSARTSRVSCLSHLREAITSAV